MILILLSFILIFIGLIFLFMKQEKFGKKPSGERLARIQKSPHYKNGAFQNISHTPPLTEGTSYFTRLKEFFFNRNKAVKPTDTIPSIKTNLFNLNPTQNGMVWFGHSSYYLQVEGKRILVDPVLSGTASPLPSGTKAFKGSNIYTTDDIPNIDILFITHDHWDHLDFDSIKKLKPKIKQIITGLGTGEHLEYWGFDKNTIIEKDWFKKIELENNFTVHTSTARHFSGRDFTRNKALWMSFILKTPNFNIFIGGDSGYDKHFAEIGNQFGPFDLAILENGQYDHKWRYIHMLPNEFIKASKELNAKRIIPVHSSKFALSNHAWNEPLEQVIQNNQHEKLNIITPLIGEWIDLDNENQSFKHWWKELK